MRLKEPQGNLEIGVRLRPVRQFWLSHHLIVYRIEPALTRVLHVLHAAKKGSELNGA